MIKVIFTTLSWLPLPLLHLMAWPLGILLILFPNKQRHYAQTNVNVCFPNWSEAKRNRIWRRSLIETIKNLLETPRLMYGNPVTVLKLVKRVSGQEHIEQGLQAGKGVIMICPHLGSWEMVGQYISHHYPMTNMYRPQKNQQLDDIIRNGRIRMGAEVVPSTQKGLKELLKALKNNRIIGTLPDQNPGAGAGVYVPFFNVQANTPVFAVRLAGKTGAMAVNVTAERLPWGRGFHLRIEPASDCLYNSNVEAGAECMNKDMEQLILKTKPEQYWWSYNRFRHRPEGEPEIY
ncbi:MAG: lysophospholipid acyltransferase family protein [Gammaproteobacteria bacterium]|nr:lysophospholipid acyltransferase family protein [Gammaproteobacteria bacterium]